MINVDEVAETLGYVTEHIEWHILVYKNDKGKMVIEEVGDE